MGARVLRVHVHHEFTCTTSTLCARDVLQGAAINKAACELARQVAAEGDALTLGGVCQTPSYLSAQSKETVQEEFRKQMNVFVENKMDFILCEVRSCCGRVKGNDEGCA